MNIGSEKLIKSLKLLRRYIATFCNGRKILPILPTFVLLIPSNGLNAKGRRPPWTAEVVGAVVDGVVRKDIRVSTVDGVPMFSLRTVRSVFGGKLLWKRVSRQVEFLTQGGSAIFTLDSSSAVVSGKVVGLQSQVRAWGNDVFVPASIVRSDKFQSLLGAVVQWDPIRKTLTVDPSPEVSSPRLFAYPSKTRLSVEIGPRVEHRVLGRRGDTLTVRFYNGRAREWEKVSVADGPIRSVEMAPRHRTTDMIVVLASGTATPNVVVTKSPRTLSFEINQGDMELSSVSDKKVVHSIPPRKGKVSTVPKKSKANPTVFAMPSFSPKKRTEIDTPFLALSPLRTIVIDPGHGGKDVGAVGKNGTLEKDVNLQIGLALARLLKSEGRYKVIMTRDNDVFIPLQERSSIANKAKADLFISLHCNAGLSRDAAGFEVYFLSEKASDDQAAAVARRENAVVELEGIVGKARQDVESLLWSLARNEHMNESSAIAGHVVQSVTGRLGLSNRGVKQAGFYVLRGTSMPAILVETAFITRPKEEGLLRSSRFHRKFVDGVYAGLLEYEKKKIQSRLASR